MNNINLIGRLTKDVELRYTESGKHVCSFCVAVDGVKDSVYFIDCVAWEARADNISKYFHKGDKIGIAGMLTTRSWEAQDGSKRKAVEVIVNSFDFCNGKKNEQADGAEPDDEPDEVNDNVKQDLPFEV